MMKRERSGLWLVEKVKLKKGKKSPGNEVKILVGRS